MMWEKDRPQIVMTNMKLATGGLLLSFIIQIYLLQFACGATEMTNQISIPESQQLTFTLKG